MALPGHWRWSSAHEWPMGSRPCEYAMCGNEATARAIETQFRQNSIQRHLGSDKAWRIVRKGGMRRPPLRSLRLLLTDFNELAVVGPDHR
jgi:hypothetical protein